MANRQRAKTQPEKKTTKTSNNHKKDSSDESILSRLLNYICVPLFLMLLTPQSVMLIWFVCRFCGGSYLCLVQYLHYNHTDVVTGVYAIWQRSQVITPFSLGVVFAFAAWSALTMVLVPGKKFNGPVTPKGNIPIYYDNGFYCYLLSMAAAIIASYFYDLTIVYDRFDEIIGTLCLFSLVFCLILYFKGKYLPSSTDSGSSGYIIFDYYWGMELYPRFLGIDIKTFTNCRFGLTAWAIIVYIFALKSFKLYGFVDSMMVSTVLQLAYLTKFFWWERGYMSTIDIMLDRAGYYICWGCLVFVPGFYTSVSHYLVTNPVRLDTPLAAIILFAGIWSLAFNYLADRQKQTARATNGKCTIWGSKARIIRAEYRLENDDKRKSILLVSGFWGQARHFHYLPELSLSLCWSLPCLFNHVFPYTYFLYLCILLTHRSYRDDDKCSKKYGKYWEEYQKAVPYRMIPGIF